MKEERNKKDLL